MPEIQREGLGFRSSPTQYSVNFQSSLGDFDVGVNWPSMQSFGH